MTRALGHAVLSKHGISNEPEFTHNRVLCAGDRIVLASDGLWNFVAQEKVCKLLSDASATPESCCTRLKEAALKAGHKYADNISIIVIFVRLMAVAEFERAEIQLTQEQEVLASHLTAESVLKDDAEGKVLPEDDDDNDDDETLFSKCVLQ